MKRFQEVLAELLDDEETLKMSLLPLLPASLPSGSSQIPSRPAIHSSIQESLIRFMLELPHLQTVLLLRLIEKLPVLDYAEGDVLEDNIPKLLLSQIRWLPWVENSTDIARGFLDAIDLASTAALKRDIITWIPETADDASADVLVPKLVSLMESESELLSVCVDTLSNIKLSEALLEQVQVSATELLNTVDPENVPVLVKFLFHVTRLDALPKLFKDLRQQLKVETLSEGSISAATAVSLSSLDSTSLLVECLRACLRAKSERATAFLQEFTAFSPKEDRSASRSAGVTNNAPSGSQHSILDIWLLLIVHASFSNLRPKLELALRKKILSGHIKPLLLRRSITIRPHALTDLYPTVMEIAQALMQHSHQDVTRTVETASKHIYVAIFCVSDMSTRHALLGQLMSHVSSASIKEARGALSTLEHLVTKHAALIEPFASFLQGLIDFMDGSQLDNSLLLQVYFIFAKLAYPNGAMSCSAETETKTAEFLTMLLLKQNGNHETRYRQMGALGSAALICILGAPVSENPDFGADSELPPEVISHIAAADKRIDDVLQTWSQVHAPEAQELFLDELSVSLTTKSRERPLRPDVVVKIASFSASMVSTLVSLRSTEAEWALSRGFSGDPTASSQSQPSPSTMWCEVSSIWPKDDPAYEEFQASVVCFNLFMEDANSLTRQSMLPWRMATCAAMIRLLFVSHEVAGALPDIYLVLYASLQLFPHPSAPTTTALHAFFNSQSQKALELIACQLIHAINILRELINIAGRLQPRAYSCFLIPMNEYVAVRLAQLVELEAYLDCVLDHIPDFPQYPGGSTAQLPLLYATEVLREAPTLKKSSRKKASAVKKGPKASPARKRKGDMDANMDADESESDEDDTEDEEENEMENGAAENATGTDAPATAAETDGRLATATASTKSWGNTGSFDVKKYRKNVFDRVTSRLRPLLPSALSALNFVKACDMDNQAIWMLIFDLVEKFAAIAPRKPSLNPAKHKPDAPWLRAYPDHKECMIELLPSLEALPSLLNVVIEKEGGPQVDDVIARNWPISLPPSVGAFASPSICFKLRYPCAKVILNLLKMTFSMPTFYSPIIADSASNATVGQGKNSIPAQDIAMALLKGLPKEEGAVSLEIHASWTEFAQACFARLAHFADLITDFETVVAIMEVLKELASSIEVDVDARTGLQDQASVLAGSILCRYWTDEEGEATAKNSIFRDGVKHMPLDGLEKVITTRIGALGMFEEHASQMAKELRMLMLKEKEMGNRPTDGEPEEEEASYRTMTKATVPTFFKTLQTCATRVLSEYSTSGLGTSDEEHGDSATDIERMTNLVAFCPYLVEKSMPAEPDRTMVGMALKQGKLFVEAFQGKLEWISAQATQQPAAVLKAMKTYQRANRALQGLCTKVKDGPYKQLGGLIAPLKRAMEMVLAKMRLLSDKHGFGDALDVRVSTAAAAGPSATAAAKGTTPRASARNGNAHEGDAQPSTALGDGSPANLKKRKHTMNDGEYIEDGEDETDAIPEAKRRA